MAKQFLMVSHYHVQLQSPHKPRMQHGVVSPRLMTMSCQFVICGEEDDGLSLCCIEILDYSTQTMVDLCQSPSQ